MKAPSICTALIASTCLFTLTACDTRDETPLAPTPSQRTPDGTAPDWAAPADNTGRNRGDADRDAKTPIDQSEAPEHIRTTADIRRAVMEDDTLSTNAKNCKIITDNTGRIWLRGVVDSQAEKDRIDQIARRIAVGATVTNELEVDLD